MFDDYNENFKAHVFHSSDIATMRVLLYIYSNHFSVPVWHMYMSLYFEIALTFFELNT